MKYYAKNWKSCLDNNKVSTNPLSSSLDELISQLKEENIKTWFDLGLFLDRLKDKKSKAGFKSDFYYFKENLVKGGIGFLTFYFAIDGITIEVAKYASAFRQLLPGVPLHLISGRIKQGK